MNEAANDSRPAVKIVKNRPLSKPIRLEDLEDCARSQAYKKKKWIDFYSVYRELKELREH